jgi:hypothetical protein
MCSNPIVHYAEQFEKVRNERMISYNQKLLKQEQEKYAREGPIGSPVAADPPPTLLNNSIRRTATSHVILIDTSDVHNAGYQIAIRDRAGHLRTPTADEFWTIRKRERDRRAPFYYLQYQPPSLLDQPTFRPWRPNKRPKMRNARPLFGYRQNVYPFPWSKRVPIAPVV